MCLTFPYSVRPMNGELFDFDWKPFSSTTHSAFGIEQREIRGGAAVERSRGDSEDTGGPVGDERKRLGKTRAPRSHETW